MKKVVVLLVCAVVLLVGDTVLDKSGIESSFDPKKDYEQGIAFYDNKDYDKAFESFKKACDGGNMRGCHNLGVMYEKGNGVEKDQIKQLICINKVCDNDIEECADILFFALNTNQGILEFLKLAQCFWLAAAVKSKEIAPSQ